MGLAGGTAAPAARRETLEGSVSFDGLATSDVGADRWVEPGRELRGKSMGSGGGNHDIHRVQGACVDCGSQLSFEEGCVKCHSCGFTECG
jgi:ribonucleoside-diphosphate reductase alpha chain